MIHGEEGNEFMKKLCAAIFSGAEIKFIAAVFVMQALSAADACTFACFLPWIFFLVCFYCFLTDWEWKRKDWVTGFFIGILLAVVTVALQKTLLMAGVAAIGGFFLGKVGNILFDAWLKSSTAARVLTLIPTFFIGMGLETEGYLFLQKNVWGGIAAAVALTLIYFGLSRELEALWSRSKKLSFVTTAGALVFAIFSAAGHLSVYEQNMSQAWFLFGILLIGWFFIFYLGLESFYGIVSRIKLTDMGHRKKGSVFVTGVLAFFTAMLGFLPYFLTFYPGVMVYDAWTQMMQVLGQPYSNHHPWIHTMIMKLLWETGIALFHSENRAIALYVCFSMALLALAIACMAGYLYSRGLKRRYLILLLLAYALSPINGMYAINMWKDTPHGAICLIFTVLLAVLYDNLKVGYNSRLLWCLFVPLSFFVCFMRSNGLYAYVLLIPFLVYVFRKQMKSVLTAVICVLVLAVVYKGPVFTYFGVEEPDIIESLSIPAQQIAAVLAYNGQITEEEKELIGQVIDLNEVPEAYLGSVHCSDSIKELVREKGNQQFISDNKGEFLKLWADLGWKNKYIYLKAFVDETEGYWYYRTSYVFIWFTYIYENGSGINRESKVPEEVETSVRKMLDGYEDHFWKYYGCSFFIYLLFFSAIVSLRKKKGFFMYVLPIGLWGTLLLATPVYADFRYIYAIFLCVPFLVVSESMEKRRGERIEGENAL